MKKLSLLILFLLSTITVLFAQSDWTNKNRLLPDKLREVPVAINVWHDPNPCYPVKEGDTYFWKHSTYVQATAQTLTVVACGSFIWYDATGWHANMDYSAKDFEEAFECPGGILQKGKTYTYKKNWRFGKQAYGGDALWYVIAKDANGKLYKGTALIETESKELSNIK